MVVWGVPPIRVNWLIPSNRTVHGGGVGGVPLIHGHNYSHPLGVG